VLAGKGAGKKKKKKVSVKNGHKGLHLGPGGGEETGKERPSGLIGKGRTNLRAFGGVESKRRGGGNKTGVEGSTGKGKPWLELPRGFCHRDQKGFATSGTTQKGLSGGLKQGKEGSRLCP